jgi:hypothetical protein
VKHPRLALAAVVIAITAVLAAGYAADGPVGVIDAAAVAAVGVLIVARGTVRGEKTRPRRLSHPSQQAPAVSAADFPVYRKMASDLEWAQLSQRHYQQIVRPMLARLATALGRPQALPANPANPANPADSSDFDGPGVNLATLDRIIASLEEQ